VVRERPLLPRTTDSNGSIYARRWQASGREPALFNLAINRAGATPHQQRDLRRRDRRCLTTASRTKH